MSSDGHENYVKHLVLVQLFRDGVHLSHQRQNIENLFLGDLAICKCKQESQSQRYGSAARRHSISDCGFLTVSRPCTRLVPVLSQRSVSVCPLWWKLVDSNSADMWSPTRIGPWTDSLSVIHGKLASTGSCTWFGTPPLR